jgi:hypothetical protein
MRCLCAELAIRVENGAGKIQPILDVCGERGVAQHDPHFVADGIHATGKHTQTYGVHTTSCVSYRGTAKAIPRHQFPSILNSPRLRKQDD